MVVSLILIIVVLLCVIALQTSVLGRLRGGWARRRRYESCMGYDRPEPGVTKNCTAMIRHGARRRRRKMHLLMEQESVAGLVQPGEDGGGMVAVSAEYCWRHCPGGCDQGCPTMVKAELAKRLG